jgi:hypothetical protein
MESKRFGRAIVLTMHARRRIAERGIDEGTVLDIIETGTAKWKDETRLWLFKEFAARDDNLLCVAAVLEQAVVVKTVMHRFVVEEAP